MLFEPSVPSVVDVPSKAFQSRPQRGVLIEFLQASIRSTSLISVGLRVSARVWYGSGQCAVA